MSHKLLHGFTSIILALVISIAGFTPALAAPPMNDNFIDAEIITSLPFSVTVDITESSNEPSETQSCPLFMDRTVWYTFTPAQSMWVSMSTEGSAVSSKVEAYHSVTPGIENLDFLKCASFGQGRTFFAEAGQKYYLQVGSLFGEVGNVQLNLLKVPPPANDNFADAQVIDSFQNTSGGINLDINTATNEGVDEPQNCFSMDRTVWYSFTPTQNTMLHMNTDENTNEGAISSNVNVYLSVGPGINDLNFLQCANSGNPTTLFAEETGQKYYLQFGSILGEVGNINLNLNGVQQPMNDAFAGTEAIPSLPFNTTVDITNATNIGEPGGCYYFMERTVWYSYTPTETSGVSVSTQGSPPNRNVNIYRAAGPDISDLTFLDCAIENDSATFVAEFGKTYYLQVGSVFDQVGTIELNLEPIPSPQNDNFINAEPVSLPLPYDHFVDLTAASSQEGEPIPSCASFGLNGTVWYAFTPAVSGAVSAHLNASEYTQLAAYTGSSLDDLTELGCNAPFGGVVSLLVEAGTTYYFQAGNFVSTQSGGMQFHLEVTPLPVADFYYNPGDPSKFDTIQFQDSSYDPGLFGIQTYQWNFGDGAFASGYSAAHKYAKDGDYQVTHTVTTVDGRTASITRTVQVRTHDVSITKITTPNSANVGQTKAITVNLRNIAYPETVQIDLYKSTATGFVWVATVTKSVPALSGNRTTAFDFNYKFTSDDAKIGKVTFKAVATLTSARDAWPSDNEIFSLQTKVAK